MNMFIPKEELAGYERFDLGSLSNDRNKQGKGAKNGPAAPAENPAALELERIATKARDAGYAAGYKEGQARATAEAKRLADLATETQKGIAHQGEEMAAEVLDLALTLARQMVRTELKVRRETLLSVVREAIDCLPHGTQGAQLILNPADIELVRTHIGDELKAANFRVVEDHRIQPGGCKIASSACEVDATLATRWKRIVATLGLDHNWLDVE